MAYAICRFGDITLPDRMPVEDMAPVEPRETLIETVAGVYSNVGLERAPQKFPHQLNLKAMAYHTTLAAFRTAIDALRSAVGTTAYLYRVADSDGAIQKALCQLRRLPGRREIENNWHQTLDLLFLQLTPWQGSDHAAWRLDSGYFLDDGLQLDPNVYSILLTTAMSQVVTNGGNLPVNDVKLTLTTASFGLFAPLFMVAPNYALLWDSTLPVNSTLVIDCGARSVTLNGVNAYEHFRLGPTHKKNDWMLLEPGANTVALIALGTKTGATWSVTFKDWWA